MDCMTGTSISASPASIFQVLHLKIKVSSLTQFYVAPGIDPKTSCILDDAVPTTLLPGLVLLSLFKGEKLTEPGSDRVSGTVPFPPRVEVLACGTVYIPLGCWKRLEFPSCLPEH